MVRGGGDNKNGESKKANSEFFDTDKDFKIYNFFNFCTRLLKKEPKEKGKAPCMIIFCSWQQLNEITEYSKQFGFKHTQPLFFVKKSSSQVLKANMRIVGATECALVLWRDKLPKFRNGRQIGEDGKPIKGTGKMIKDWFEFERDGKDIPKIHPTQKPVNLLKQLIEIYTDEVDMVNHPPHYQHGIEPIEFIESHNLNFNLGSAVKYIARAPYKGTELLDLKKAKWFIEREIKRHDK